MVVAQIVCVTTTMPTISPSSAASRRKHPVRSRHVAELTRGQNIDAADMALDISLKLFQVRARRGAHQNENRLVLA
jgi:hypothetical protein